MATGTRHKCLVDVHAYEAATGLAVRAKAPARVDRRVQAQSTPTAGDLLREAFGEACRAAGCPGSAHGLRKAGAMRAAERGASERQLMAIFGWSTGKMAQHYTRTADRARLAQAAAELLMPEAAN